MQALANRLHRMVLGLSIVLFAVMFTAQLVIVLMRYVMGVGFLELQDLVTYCFSALVVLTIPLALRLDRHVRVDILRTRFSRRRNARIDRAGHILFALPVFGLLLWNALPLVSSSWAILEGSRETGGLGGLFVVKSTVVVMSLLVIVLAVIDLVNGRGDER
ncbi:MAG: C4-dicarboxylate ABC transporter permease [Rhodobacterales bacterium CG2_30_65_12]|nr:MAG: C4-dicarboxylate ABC transporter permease [Rhodobacterales bacterium CG2_30_65_12]